MDTVANEISALLYKFRDHAAFECYYRVQRDLKSGEKETDDANAIHEQIIKLVNGLEEGL